MIVSRAIHVSGIDEVDPALSAAARRAYEMWRRSDIGSGPEWQRLRDFEREAWTEVARVARSVHAD